MCVHACTCVFTLFLLLLEIILNAFFCCLEALSLCLSVLVIIPSDLSFNFCLQTLSFHFSFTLFLLSAHFLSIIMPLFSPCSQFFPSLPPKLYHTLITFLTLIDLFTIGWRIHQSLLPLSSTLAFWWYWLFSANLLTSGIAVKQLHNYWVANELTAR